MSTITVSVPNVQLTLEQLIIAVRQLETDARSKIAQVLLTDDMDERFTQLIERLANKHPVTDISDEEINEAVRVVRSQRL